MWKKTKKWKEQNRSCFSTGLNFYYHYQKTSKPDSGFIIEQEIRKIKEREKYFSLDRRAFDFIVYLSYKTKFGALEFVLFYIVYCVLTTSF